MKAGFRTLVVFGLGLALGLGLAEVRRQRNQDERPVATAAVFQHVLQAIRADFVDSLSDEELYVKAARGVVNTLGDPYSALLGPAEYRGYSDMLKGRGETLGLSLASGITGLVVADVVPGTPGDEAGIKPGDYLLGIGERSTTGLSAATATGLLRPDTTGQVMIRFRPPSDPMPVQVSLRASRGALPAVHSVVRLNDSVGYFALRTLSDKAADEVRDALAALDASALGSLVIDLRGNRGGRLDEGLAVADLFLPGGKQIGSVAKRRSRWGYSAARPEVYPGLKLVLLVDRNTASSAEIVAAALRDNDRARLVGERTFGKGLIQTTIPLGDSIAIRLTTGRWQGPGGKLIDGGIVPDLTVRQSEWEASLLRALAPRTEVLVRTLDEFAARRALAKTPPDSARLTTAEMEVLRGRIRTAGLALSRQTMAAHRGLFDRELSRLVAVRTGDPAAAVRFGLLGDAAVSAALASLGRPGPSPAEP